MAKADRKAIFITGLVIAFIFLSILVFLEFSENECEAWGGTLVHMNESCVSGDVEVFTNDMALCPDCNCCVKIDPAE